MNGWDVKVGRSERTNLPRSNGRNRQEFCDVRLPPIKGHLIFKGNPDHRRRDLVVDLSIGLFADAR
jgi:hypothetical protein